jgi:transposase
MLYAKNNPQANAEMLTELKQTRESHWYRRLKIIHLSSQGMSVPELAKFFDCCAATVRDYITRYNTEGLPRLRRQSSDGAPIKIPLTKAAWEELLHQSPSQFERLQTGARNWTQELLQQYLRAYHQIAVTQQAISAALKRHHIAWNRGKLKVTSPDPLYTVKRDRIEALKKSARGNLNQS